MVRLRLNGGTPERWHAYACFLPGNVYLSDHKAAGNMIKKAVIHELLQNHPLHTVEQHLIYAYLQAHNIKYLQSPVLGNYFNGFEPSAALHNITSALHISSLKELENYLEMLIPASDRKLNGAFFTPAYIIDYIIHELQPGPDDTNLDPSCGCGAFLTGLVDYYRRTYQKPIRAIVKENIFGADILDYNIHRTKLILSIYALQQGEELQEDDFNLWQHDSLRASWTMTFDNIVGNPPYVKLQDLSQQNREYLADHWTTIRGGSFNIYFSFFELGYQLLRPAGKLGFITPNNYFTSLAGRSLRQFFQQQQCIARIIDFSHKKVFDAQTYTAITFINKQKNEAILYDRIGEQQSPETFLAHANGSFNDLKDLDTRKWRLLKTGERKNISLIENAGIAIGQLFDISVGIATLKDEVFFIDGSIEENGCYSKTTSNGIFAIEKDATKPVIKIPDCKDESTVRQNSRRIICPYSFHNGTATPIPEPAFREQFPNCYDYLLTEKENLLSRDKRKVAYDPFYVWGRSQGLTKTGIKLLTPTFSQHPRFIITEEDAFFTNGYGLFFKESKHQHLACRPENIDVLQKILNSGLMHYYISKTSITIQGGYPCYQKNFIEKFTIPALSQAEVDTIRSLPSGQELDEYLSGLYQLDDYTTDLPGYE